MNGIVPEITARRAMRALSPEKIPGEIVERMLEAATLAASCSNNQPWRFIAVTDPAVLDEVKQHLTRGNYWAKRSPFIVAVCTRSDFDCELPEGRNYAYYDTGMAVAHLLLQGVREGLYTHPIAGFDPLPIKKLLGVPPSVTLLNLVIFGYPGDFNLLSEKHGKSEHSTRTRKSDDQVISYNAWSSALES